MLTKYQKLSLTKEVLILAIYGYARVSTSGQSLEEQVDMLEHNGVDRDNIYSEKYTGTTLDRTVFNELIEILKPHDILVITKLDRFARNTREALNIIEPLLNNKVTIKVLNLGTIEDTPIGKMIMRTLLSVAEMERDLIIERTSAGKKFAKSHNSNFKEGRPKRTIGTHENAIYDYYRDHSVKETIAAFNISKSTLFRIKKQIEEERR